MNKQEFTFCKPQFSWAGQEILGCSYSAWAEFWAGRTGSLGRCWQLACHSCVLDLMGHLILVSARAAV